MTADQIIADIFTRAIQNLAGRIHGPLTFRLMLQPMAAAFLAFRAGLRDAREGRPPYGWTILTHSGHRGEDFHRGWRDVWRIFCAAIIIDVIYEIIVFRWVYPLETL